MYCKSQRCIASNVVILMYSFALLGTSDRKQRLPGDVPYSWPFEENLGVIPVCRLCERAKGFL